ncbi:MAG: hypothetical protein BWX88_01387 [Planctomycetes bacterium ADurb.Bin126]|nr:MAG: hypothetical protein BWX88_01387 [Planctomycetes bacterium ADurb.Bin126]HOD82414.1 prepilin-type N-terminal cleavage/methylation domain-containing protein [Phycisphaerae bacterium]HQL72355.1 prepilin-type N-terminal cleavage/methylation domain-containing protein [Phycisphaerae bacterium]
MTAFNRPSRRAFTLVELLVVISILALLLAILTPSLHRAREMARLITCQTRMAALQKASTAYATANHSFFPHYAQWLCIGNGTSNSRAWLERGTLWPYMRQPLAYLCPGDDLKRHDPGPGVTPRAIGTGSGYGDYVIHSYVRIGTICNYVESHMGGATADPRNPGKADHIRASDLLPGFMTPAKTGNIPGTTIPYASAPLSPARIGMYFEEAQGTEFEIEDAYRPSGYGLNALLNDGHSYYDYAQDFMTIRHSGNGNIVFYDGHVMYADARRYNMYPADGYTEAVVLTGIEPVKP